MLIAGNRSFRVQAVGFFILGVITSIAIGNSPIIVAFPTLIMPLSSLQLLMYADGRKDWEGFRLVLPLTRHAVVAGRYATFAVVVVATLVLGIAIYGVACLLAPLLTGIVRLAPASPAPFDGTILLAVFAACCLLLSFVLSVVLPLFMRMGALKVPPLVVAIPILVVMLAFNAVMPYLREWMALLNNPGQTVLFSGIALAVALGLYAVSAAVSMKLYLTRDF
ncbi:MAG: ABC-2 transporter permease [Gordonibacter sp.]|uniref:ABC-2 transporter permease n=1 Tax=Gordonibacter sp. TaxID=1968902 RepID=UPI002FC8EF32